MVGNNGVDNHDHDHAHHSPGDAEGPRSPSEPQESGSSPNPTGKQIEPSTSLPRWWIIVKEALEVASLFAIIVTMIFIGLQWYEMGRQYNIMSQQLADARASAAHQQKATDRALKTAESQADSLAKLADANKAIADAARTNATNSTKTLEFADRQFRLIRLSEMPVLVGGGVSSPSGGGNVFGDKRVTIFAYVKNTGPSPALKCHIAGCLLFGAPPPPPDIKCPRDSAVVIIGAYGSQYMPISVGPFTDSEREEWRTGAKRMWVVIRADYEDQLGTKYALDSCYVMMPGLEVWVHCDERVHAKSE